MTDPNDILNGCLEECLTGAQPPDLTVRILTAYEASHDILDAPLEEVLAGVTPPNVVAQVMQGSPRSISAGTQPSSGAPLAIVRQPAATARFKRRNYVAWASLALTLAAVVCGLVIGWDAWKDSPAGNPSEIAQEKDSIAPPPSPSEPAPHDFAVQPIEEPQPTPPLPVELIPIPEPAIKHPLQLRNPLLAANSVEAPPSNDELTSHPRDEIVRTINTSIEKRWQAENATPADSLSERQWCNRVYERIIGREAAHYELAAFVADRSPDKRAKLVNRLLRDDWYIEDFSAHWADVWSDILLATADRPTNRERLDQFLRRAFAEGRPWDQLATQLIAATGSGSPEAAAGIEADDFNGAVNYLLAYADRGGSSEPRGEGTHALASAHVSRTFLGHAMECSQCHHDASWRGYKQESFWELNAFFQQLKVDPRGRLANADFRGEGGSPEEAEIYYSLRNGLLKAAYPKFVDPLVEGFDTVPRSGLLSDVDRRKELAAFVVRSQRFRQAMVNRFWSEVFGAGFTNPVDDLGPHNPASHPELLVDLGDQFAAHGYDVRSLLEWMVLSEPFSLAPETDSPDRRLGTQELFASFPVIRRREEPLESALALAVNLHTEHNQFPAGVPAAARLAPSAPGAQPAEISQVDRLLAATRSEVHRASDESLFGQIILDSKLSTDQKIQHMFYATVHRPPTKHELDRIGELLEEPSVAEHPTNPWAVEDALRYVWWALSSSRDAR